MSKNAITLADITSADWSLALDTQGVPGSGLGNVAQGLADVNQCLWIILTTSKGSDPLRPTFGADVWRYIDAPINSAIPAIVREVTEAILRWEPRVTLVSINVRPTLNGDTQAGAHLNIWVNWKLKLSVSGSRTSPFAQSQSTLVTFSTPR